MSVIEFMNLPPIYRRSLQSVHLVFLFLMGFVSIAYPAVDIVSTPNSGQVPDAEIDNSGAIHVAYVLGDNAYYAKSGDNGKTFSKSLLINSETNSVHPANMFRGPDLAVGANGRVHVIWYSNGYQRKLPQDQWGVFYSHLDSGQNRFADGLNLNHKPSDNYSLAANSEGDVSVIWMAGKLFVTSSRDNGETFPATETVTNANPCECCASRALFNGHNLFIDYRDKTDNIRDMQLLVREPSQVAFSNRKISTDPWPITGCPMTGTYLSKRGDSALMAWETKGHVYYGRVDTKSTNRPNEVKVSEKGKWPVALAGADGTVLVSWKEGATLHWQLFDA
ncbi:MAG: hypothetical protein JWM04_2751, partial [Verrucomicrobiales bacterium]|nr:hypothetical protein [Verrucomicrobiales bacterium]